MPLLELAGAVARGTASASYGLIPSSFRKDATPGLHRESIQGFRNGA